VLRTYQHPCIYYRGADKSLARPTSRFFLFDGENISFDANLVIYINSTNIPPIMIINRIYETQNLLSLELVSILVGLRTYQHRCTSSKLRNTVNQIRDNIEPYSLKCLHKFGLLTPVY
jgi:hypothetical protein